jgi:hypothetical protein
MLKNIDPLISSQTQKSTELIHPSHMMCAWYEMQLTCTGHTHLCKASGSATLHAIKFTCPSQVHVKLRHIIQCVQCTHLKGWSYTCVHEVHALRALCYHHIRSNGCVLLVCMQLMQLEHVCLGLVSGNLVPAQAIQLTIANLHTG